MEVKVKRKAKPLLIILIIGIVILFSIAGTWMVLSGPVSRKSKAAIEVVIPVGATSRQIGTILKEKDLIKNEFFFNVYIKINGVGAMKASTYTLSKSMSLSEIVDSLVTGNSYNPNVIKITFKEGERITDYATDIAEKTNHSYEDVIAVMKDKTYAQSLINKYWFLTDEILNPSIYYPLEGYLAPNTYNFANKDVSVQAIIETMLKQTEKNLAKYKNKMPKGAHYYMTMASMAELEGTNTDNRKSIVNVFENRLAIRMNLGSDVTTYYALQLPMNRDLTTQEFTTPNPYNTRSTTLAGKMPVGPICNPSTSSIEASINPTTGEKYLYFVADKYGKIYFTSTLAEHNAKVKEIKEAGGWIW